MKIKNTLLLVLALMLCCALPLVAQTTTKTQLSSHILDISRGKPAEGVSIVLYKQDVATGDFVKVAADTTNADGRVAGFLPQGDNNDGTYKLRFETRPYFDAQGLQSIYPFVEVVFDIAGTQHYHIPITLSANGYATYRGS